MFKKWLVIITILLSTQAKAYKEGEHLSDSAQKQLQLDQNRVSIIDFFAEWCTSCRKELPEVNALIPQLSQMGVPVIGIDVDEDKVVAKAFQQSLGLNFRIINDDKQTLVGDFQPIGMPALYYVYQNKVIKIRYGAINQISEVIIADIKNISANIKK